MQGLCSWCFVQTSVFSRNNHLEIDSIRPSNMGSHFSVDNSCGKKIKNPSLYPQPGGIRHLHPWRRIYTCKLELITIKVRALVQPAGWVTPGALAVFRGTVTTRAPGHCRAGEHRRSPDTHRKRPLVLPLNRLP